MNCFKTGLLVAAACGVSGAATADVLLFEDFEDASVTYTTSEPEFSDGTGDFWLRTDGSDIGTFVEYGGVQGTSFFAGMDLDGEGAALPLIQTFSGINIAGFTNLNFSTLLAEDDDGTNEDWDDTDSVLFEYQVDGGGFTTLFEVVGENFTSTSGPFNGNPAVGGVEVTSTFAEFSEAIAGTGSLLDVRVTWSANSGDEDLAIDNVTVTGDIPEPGSLALLGLGGLLIARRRRSA